MKIDPVTYEVDVSAGTHPLYVWEAPVRIWHWAMAVCMAVMIVTGFLIGAPLVANLGDTWATYDFAYIRLAHFAAGMIFTVIFIWRLYWGIVGNKYSRMILVPPLWSLKWWKMLFEQVKYYLFLRKTSPEYAGHNPLAQCAMFFMFTLGSIVIIITGLALYAQAWGALWRQPGRSHHAPRVHVHLHPLLDCSHLHELPRRRHGRCHHHQLDDERLENVQARRRRTLTATQPVQPYGAAASDGLQATAVRVFLCAV